MKTEYYITHLRTELMDQFLDECKSLGSPISDKFSASMGIFCLELTDEDLNFLKLKYEIVATKMSDKLKMFRLRAEHHAGEKYSGSKSIHPVAEYLREIMYPDSGPEIDDYQKGT